MRPNAASASVCEEAGLRTDDGLDLVCEPDARKDGGRRLAEHSPRFDATQVTLCYATLCDPAFENLDAPPIKTARPGLRVRWFDAREQMLALLRRDHANTVFRGQAFSKRKIDGSLAFRQYVSESADGNTHVTQFDNDGNGTVDRSQTDDLMTNANGSSVRTVANINADGSLANRKITTKSVDGKTVTTQWTKTATGLRIRARLIPSTQRSQT
jgi:hypothetical protein